jgi:hypothetical protein
VLKNVFIRIEDSYSPNFLSSYFFVVLGFELRAYKAGALPFEPLLQSLFWRWDFDFQNYLP